MKVICTLGLLLTWLTVVFILGFAVGVRVGMASSVPAGPASTRATGQNWVRFDAPRGIVRDIA